MHSIATFIAGLFAVVGSWFGGHTELPVQLPATTTASVTSAPSTTTTEASALGALATSTARTSAPAIATTTVQSSASINLKAIPLGDGKVSAAPKVGYVYSCTTAFRGGGAEHAGDWITGSTWNLYKKISVEGSVSWPQATFSNIVQSTVRLITGNGLPVGSKTGNYPIARTDPAYQYDRNPNSVKEQNISYSLSASPSFAANASCVPMGAVGVALNGVAIYNALDDAGRDAVAHEVQDSCEGHPQSLGQYHYHGPSECMPHVNERDAVVGYALDGFPITSLYNAQGNLYTNDELDACHGTTSSIIVDGKSVNRYHYVLTEEYPYTLGCFRGTPLHNARPPKGV